MRCYLVRAATRLKIQWPGERGNDECLLEATMKIMSTWNSTFCYVVTSLSKKCDLGYDHGDRCSRFDSGRQFQ
eukprot:1147119-Pelagomonas_calceolata.AAC.1